MLLNVERLAAISNPLSAKSKFSVSRNALYFALLVCVGLALYVFIALTIMTIGYAPMLIGGLSKCKADTSTVWKSVVFQGVYNVAMYILPPVISIVLSVLLVVIIRRQLLSREKLMHQTNSSGAGGAAAAGLASKSAIAGGIVAVTMSLVNGAIHLPAGIFGLFYFMCVLFYELFHVWVAQLKLLDF